MHTVSAPNCCLQSVSTHPPRSDRIYIVVDPGGQHDRLDKAIVLQEYTELHNILLRQLPAQSDGGGVGLRGVYLDGLQDYIHRKRR